ncbi:MAG: CHASE3 domain-containing protein [Bradyrhizobium sp.]|uniref:sensor histidine kinase n=1 Tax=Bradyrhizobium sp. TaxID=376 RepID=UPI001EBC9437|nr:CHASE3 domain-containing protein [Bradyrhizobium sp.]MBU6456025.1 CHASE3 domain-containing protein [Bradyrhizobium sp.]MDE2329832.1 CHASE3 domain-containing protein [Bradyrhizobium sp.]MDE2600928.1 CHASE3 domain-containing protein [Bradyrhizobium sp.]
MLVAISTTSVVLVNQSRKDNGRVVHTVEVENQMNALLLELRRAESATRGFLLTSEPRFRAEYETAAAAVVADVDKLRSLIGDNPVQIENVKRLQQPIEGLLGEFARSIDFANRHDAPGGVEVMREADTHNLAQRMNDVVENMRAEEDRSLAQRTRTADGTQQLASVVTVAGSGLVIVLAAISIWLVRRSSRARDDAESRMRDNNLNLETMVDERTADLREANDEIQRFAYIVSHDLRSPLVNIMGFTSELEQLRGDIFRRIATLDRAGAEAPLMPADGDDVEPLLGGEDGQLSQDFAEALGFIKSSIAKMDRLISAILNLTREGRRRFEPVKIDIRELIAGIVATVAHQAAEAKAEIHIEPLPSIVSDRLAIEQIFSNLIDNALKYLKPGVPGDIRVRGRTKLGFAIFEIADNGRGIDPRDHQRIFDLFRRAGTQDKPGEGIGLAYVRALVRRLGGTMSVTSELNRGSTFTITLPLVWATTNRNGDS